MSEKTLRQSGNERDESQEKVWWGIEKKNDTESWESQQLVLVGSEDFFYGKDEYHKHSAAIYGNSEHLEEKRQIFSVKKDNWLTFFYS